MPASSSLIFPSKPGRAGFGVGTNAASILVRCSITGSADASIKRDIDVFLVPLGVEPA